MKACPRCGSGLTETSVGEVRVDGCDGCGGVWFDHQELNTVARTQAAQLADLEQQFAPHTAPAERHGSMQCPACQVPLREFEFKHSPGIRLNGCPQCRGIWVDDGELRAIHARILSALASTPPVADASPSEETAPPTPGTRQKARQALGFLTTVACVACGQPNAIACAVCWACGQSMDRERGCFCPRCDRPLTGKVALGVRFDACECCGGMWLDQGEFPRLAREGPEAMKQLEEELGQGKTLRPPLLEGNDVLICPTCHVPVLGRQYGVNSGIYINVCKGCRGMWLDSGELTLVAENYAQS
jgi:Zn-finger nucleic acid-binding protein